MDKLCVNMFLGTHSPAQQRADICKGYIQIFPAALQKISVTNNRPCLSGPEAPPPLPDLSNTRFQVMLSEGGKLNFPAFLHLHVRAIPNGEEYSFNL